MGLVCPDQDEGEGQATNSSSSPEGFCTQVPPPKIFLLPLFLTLSPPSRLFPLRLQSFQVLAWTLQIPSYLEPGKPEGGFDHSRSLITADEHANWQQPRLLPPVPRTPRGRKAPRDRFPDHPEERPEGAGLWKHPRSLCPLFCCLAQERHSRAFRQQGVKMQRRKKRSKERRGGCREVTQSPRPLNTPFLHRHPCKSMMLP